MRMLADPKFALGDRDVVATVTVRGSNAVERSISLRLSRTGGKATVSVVP